MLQFIALAITFVAIYRQLRAQHMLLRDNSKVLRSQAHYNAVSLAQTAGGVADPNEGLSAVVSVGYETPEVLSAVDWARFGPYIFMQLNGWEYLYTRIAMVRSQRSDSI